MKILCGRTVQVMYRSPAGPPLRPGSPSPGMVLKFCPSSTPAGTLSVTVRVTRVKPVPEHLLHLSLMILPLPPQVGHVRIVCT